MAKYERMARLLFIPHVLRQNPQGTRVDELAKRFEVTRKTIYEDLRELEGATMRVPIWSEKGRWFIDSGFFLPTVKLSLHEATALFLATRLAYRHRDERDRTLEVACDKLATVLPQQIGRQVQATVEAMQRRPLNDTFNRTLEILISAWAEGKRVRIEYHATEPSAVRERVIEPYLLEPIGASHALYVVARDVEADALRTFKVERIRGIAVMAETFTVPEDFDPETYFQSSFTVWEGPPVDVTVRFSAAVARYLAEARWHPSQQIEPLENGDVLWRARVAGTVEITPWIRSWGPDAEVLAPPDLRARIARESREQAALYK